MKITSHQFIKSNPIIETDEKLILGTIHPHDVSSFKLPFFYGNRNSLWKIFRDIFPKDLPQDYSVDDIKRLLSKRKIGISDTVLQCERITNSALDRDFRFIQLNDGLVNEIKESKIIQIYCTSGFGKNNAFRLFYVDILGLNLTKEIRQNKSVILPKEIFGREVTMSILPSPSGAANIALSKSIGYKKSLYFNSLSTTPVYDYKVSLYTEIFQQCLSKN
ncbi:hypothetical protein [Sphingobacterium sp. BIGb0165]|uniref:hypothetical protein n=1 Tax=Sphingobacterium sp. BIGb0165 TaxID=2940615 RepID=UPI002168DCDC|nr:hypothetical protein [Sphingobacterium sp. BIGb0165]MCS4224711.1 G:T/U-mismatch repair DNA glycosylase [Sphingobacterium sp. BIGb0165]